MAMGFLQLNVKGIFFLDTPEAYGIVVGQFKMHGE
jgi:hypothetical protein